MRSSTGRWVSGDDFFDREDELMNESPEPTIRKFNPGTFQSDEEVIRQFVVRKRELGIVLDTLRGNVGAPSCQHVLLVGPRGRGKTMLLARVAAEIRTDEELSGQLLPVRFMEESHEIFDLGDFWLEALFYLTREITDSHPRISRDLQTTHAALARQERGAEFEERVRATVLETADRLGRQLVLMVENLQAMCGDVDDDFGWKLRESLQTEPKVMLLATATSRFEGLDDTREPFFELFRIVCLERLDTEECQRLWQMASGEARSERQIKALEILTGGDPRLLVIVAEFSRHRSLHDLMEEMVSLIDEHTEYFRSHLDGFAKTERRVYLSVIDLWQPSYASEVAARARMDIRTVSSLLGRLADRGVVTVEGGGRKRQYSATQRLYSIYYKLRRERDEAVVVQNLIHFMAVFYTDEELTEMSGKLRLEALQYPFIRDGNAEWKRAKALIVRGDPSAATAAFRSAYAAFAPDDGAKLRMMIELVPDLIAVGVSERDLVEILSSDQEKSAKLAPLVVALRQHMGEEVRAPIEVLEVAADIIQRIEADVRQES